MNPPTIWTWKPSSPCKSAWNTIPARWSFVSHDREFVGGLATRIIELRPGGGIVDFKGTYDEYLKGQGIEA